MDIVWKLEFLAILHIAMNILAVAENQYLITY